MLKWLRGVLNKDLKVGVDIALYQWDDLCPNPMEAPLMVVDEKYVVNEAGFVILN